MGLFSGGNSRNATTNEGDSPTNNVDYGTLDGIDQSVTLGRGANQSTSIGVSGDYKNVYNITDGGAASSAMNAVTEAYKDSNASVSQTSRDALGSNEAVSRSAIAGQVIASEMAMGVADRAIEQAAKQSAAHAKQLQKALAATNQLAGTANTNMANLAGSSINGAYNFAGASLSKYESLSGRAMDEMNRANALSQAGTEKAMDYVFKSTQTGEERQAETLIKYGTWGAVAIAVALLLMLFAGKR